ncbi:MAG: peptidylprolyl isomerase, partial [Bacilli bacterium]|nr:peptidylprolyl isomerase [Bacilli bacterium]
MKKGKLALALTTGLLSITAMASCNEVTYAEGIALSYEDAAGVRHNYSAKELLADYQKSKATASTDFEKIKEILIRKYYASRPADLVTIEEDAKKAVDGVKDTAKKNANDNGTQYGAELETLLKGENCDNIEELYEKKLYEIEKEKYNADYYSQAQLEAMRDGGTDKDGNGVISADEKIFPDSADWGAGSDGYIDTRMPYHVSHILVEASGCSETDPTSATLSADESRNIGQMVEYMAGASIQSSKHGLEPAATRTSFGELAKTYSKDPGSAQEFGNLGIMDKSTSFVQGFQYGVYAYDTLFNQKNAGKANL